MHLTCTISRKGWGVFFAHETQLIAHELLIFMALCGPQSNHLHLPGNPHASYWVSRKASRTPLTGTHMRVSQSFLPTLPPAEGGRERTLPPNLVVKGRGEKVVDVWRSFQMPHYLRLMQCNNLTRLLFCGSLQLSDDMACKLLKAEYRWPYCIFEVSEGCFTDHIFKSLLLFKLKLL